MRNILTEQDKKAEAKVYFAMALAVNPNDYFAKMILGRIKEEK